MRRETGRWILQADIIFDTWDEALEALPETAPLRVIPQIIRSEGG